MRNGAATTAAAAADGTIRLLMLFRAGNPLKAVAPVGIRRLSWAVWMEGTVVVVVFGVGNTPSRSSSGDDVCILPLGTEEDIAIVAEVVTMD